ncbi:2,3-bisphosphoglycerate-independent phosphoglycerate mutase [Acidaminobacter sp. JC074]|uniref:alkaline phosphatase family protein n=1 Tax=Acidaminobacter sp. JC074 TaxID=2530199 RepID=UPI001F0EA3EF|nr:phosphoglycerate mutase [Acidaminobacter sp. JC074]MCH4890429.1 2,3-bisphosphoglycerate-independent phosphoglycerate mutase [Acidaminobacter sp. JC074]
MKCINLLLDGASDRSYKELEGQTPLQYANLPNLDKIASKGQCGLMTPLSEGIALGTDLAHFLMFNYKVSEYPSRSIIDAVGEELTIDKEALYLRCSIATVEYDEGYKLLHRFTPQLSDEEIEDLSPVLKTSIDGYDFDFVHSYDSHGFIVVRGSDLTDHVSDSDPFRPGKYAMAVEPFEDDSDASKKLSDAINTYLKYSYDVLSKHRVNISRHVPGNMILTKWAGIYKRVEPFKKRNGMTALLIGNSKLLRGLASYIGMDYFHYESFEEGLEYALECDYDYVHLHTKDPDTASHKKSPELKVQVLEDLDGKIQKLVDFEGLLVVTSDHSTPCAGSNIHSGESVAFMASGDYIRIDHVRSFDEVSCSQGSIRLKNSDLMNYVINATDRGCLYHLKQGSSKKNYIVNDEKRLL